MRSSLPSRLFDRSPAASCETPSSVKYQRHVDCAPDAADDGGPKERWPRDMTFAFRPERYEPLTDDGAKEKRRKKRKENYKKVRKNVGKALRTTWKCLKLGLYNFAFAYSTPVTVAAAFAPDFYHDRNET
ncbi:uncharacterized protein C1orf115 [Austrofundulus limnaeus]|uniref:Uncharacterized protein C1orf115 n=1 Tax=Austrofundulus limnaeus TaxID=52670 RepID=A0A2I4BH07_AUSLI|nr:PREDICTED: uncharacterized protein C1orf115 homolog [Austrofundulus limnaeus]